MPLPCNVGGADKTVRIVLGVLFLALVLLFDFSTTVTVLLVVLAGIALVTAFVGFCPLNRVLGVDTCRRAAA
ncbi:MAG: DUF2892 domain-containing protein [Rhodothermales bacterium]|nr:DUF2892 domain-containing protein [Rhodothermales bacterium]